ncbi:hypothetical protein IQ07DRAFT_607065 [Pyrenochaeta sp. DS3sAY3a]|nr:hypothetical protein IQ07DRAFT_607065 [Pyrenochaeta sp. DS3sAY3a]
MSDENEVSLPVYVRDPRIPHTTLGNLGCIAFFEKNSTIWPSKHIEEHPIIETIRTVVLQYRLQSASHFDISIEVHQTKNPKYAGNSTKIDQSFRIEVLFHNFSNRLYRICRVRTGKRRRPSHHAIGCDIEVQEQGSFIPLRKFLSTAYLNLNDSVTSDTLYSWWSINGKSFNWTGLPTEVKECIVGSCIELARTADLTNRSLRLWKRNYWKPGTHELADHLGRWIPLLRVSHQHMPSVKGMCLLSITLSDFSEKIRRLGKFFQMVEANGVPVDDKSYASAYNYMRFPKLYPELKQYATLRHGIRRICLELDFSTSFEFFRITKHGYNEGWESRHFGIEVLERLPDLRELTIILPDVTGKLEDKPYHPGPRLFYDLDFACPRILHRILYEQAAEVLAPYKDVKLYGFMDENEAQRFKALQQKAILLLKFTPRELRELYAEDGGGIQLEKPVTPGMDANQLEDDSLDTMRPVVARNNFWPPKCRCEVRCRHVILGRG